MNAPQSPPVGASDRPAARFSLRASSQRTLVLYLIAALLVAGVVFLVLSPRPSEPPPASERINPLPQPLPEITAPAPPPPPDSPRLEQLDERIAGLSRSFEDLQDRFATIEARLIAMDEHDDELRARLEALANRPAPVPTSRLASAKRPKPAPPAPRMPTVLSIDTWGSEPSVAIRDLQGELAFYREGDAVGIARIERIDPKARRVHLRLPDGTVTAVGAEN